MDVEQTNDGDYVEMLRKVEERLAKRLPKLGIARHRALLHSYEPPFVEAEVLDHDRPGWGPRRRLRLTCPIAQALLDLVIAHELLVYLVVRDDTITDKRFVRRASPSAVRPNSSRAQDPAVSAMSRGTPALHS